MVADSVAELISLKAAPFYRFGPDGQSQIGAIDGK
jgi:hypothetical protein